MKVENLCKLLEDGTPVQVPSYLMVGFWEEWNKVENKPKVQISTYKQNFYIIPLTLEKKCDTIID